jgi:hypothetical protein
MKTKTRGRADLAAQAKQLIAGVDKLLANQTQVLLAGGTFTPAQITQRLQAIVTLRADVDAAKASTRAKLASEKADMPALRIFMDALATFVKAAYGTSPESLAAFGIVPKARKQLTVEEKAAAAAKRAATRTARHTMGTKQKKVVKGDVVGITVTPVTAPAPVVKAASSPTAAATSPAPTAAAAPHTGT